MKKMIIILLALALVLSFAACGNQTPSTPITTEPTFEPTTEPTPEPTVEVYSDFELCAEYAITKLKDILKNPNSLVVNNLCGVEDDGNYIFSIDYTAENSFGGAGRDTFYLDVGKIDNGFSVITLGSDVYSSDTNQSFTKQVYRQKAELGYYEFDAETHRLNAYIENVYEYEDIEGELRGKNESYENAWNFKLEDDDYLKLVYFADDVDLSAFNEEYNTRGENKVIIHAYRIGTHFYDATIVYADAYKTAEERLISFNYHDRNFFKEYVKDMIPLTEDEIRTALEGHTFSMRNNYGGDVDGTHTISFYPYGSLDAKYITSANNELVMFETWQIENGSVVLSLPSGNDIVLKPYQYDETRFLLIDETGDYSMVLTKTQ